PETLRVEFTQALNMLEGYLKLNNIESQTIIKTCKLEEMPMIYRNADLFVLASENETFGQVLIEAMACGVPVIASNVGGIPEIISDSYNGYLIPSEDSSILAQKIEVLLNDNDIREQFIKRSYKII